MSWRTVIISSIAKLDYQLGYLIIRTNEKKKIFLDEVGILIVENTSVSLTAYLLNELTKRKIKVIFCDEKRNPSFEVLPYYGSYNTSLKVKKQIKWKQTIKDNIWTLIVREKIQNQSLLLKSLDNKEYLLLEQYINELQPGDTTNREGHAAKVYFNSLFGKNFSRNDDSSINAALNYGYSLILSIFNREIVSNGYLTQLGIFHDNRFNPYNLSSDLMEPFRPLVDSYIIKMGINKFDTEEKHAIIQLLDQKLYICNKLERLPNVIRIYTKNVLYALNNEDNSLIEFFKYEL